jgi:hypothetical protein
MYLFIYLCKLSHSHHLIVCGLWLQEPIVAACYYIFGQNSQAFYAVNKKN